MAAKFIENGILGTSRKCFQGWRKGWNVGGQDSGCEISEEGGTLADRIPDARYPRKVERQRGRIPDVRHPDGMAAEKEFQV